MRITPFILVLALAACGAGNAPFEQIGQSAATAPTDTPDVSQGGSQPFGQVTRVCDVSDGDLGRAVAQAPSDGRARWKLHDTAPNATGSRTHYLTGFSDSCARQITGALILFGSPLVHEAARYDTANRRAYSATDTAYEQIKGALCGVRRGAPCPADRTGRLTQRISFVTIYPTFAGEGPRQELLLDDGKLVAQSVLPG